MPQMAQNDTGNARTTSDELKRTKTERQKYEKAIHRTQKASRQIPMKQNEPRWTKDKLGQKDRNTDRQKDRKTKI